MRQATASIMRRALERERHVERIVPPRIVTLQAPVGGLNGRDALDDMKPEDAVQLVNWFPGFGKVEVRGGSADWGQLGATVEEVFTAATATVETLVAFKRESEVLMVAACGGALYDATAGGELGTALDDGFTNNRWQHAVMNDSLGLVNGADAPQVYDGSSLTAMTLDEADGESATLTPADLIGINVYKSRSYFWDGTAGFWYSAVNALGGDLEYFPLGDVGGAGGHLTVMITWSRDGGEGMDDLAVFIMSSGDVLVYAGSDPGEANDWSLVGVFKIGSPVGIRAVSKLGGDALIATADGYTLLSQALPGIRGARGINVSDKLGKFALDQVQQSGTSFGWQIVHWPRGRRVLVNFPSHDHFEQHVVNLATGAWTLFQGLEASCWAVWNDRLFFGTVNGEIVEAETGTSDRGVNILAIGQQAFSELRVPGRIKSVKMVRPLIEASSEVRIEVDLYADYSPQSTGAVAADLGLAGDEGGEWYDAEWYDAFWAGPTITVPGWIGHAARGYAISPAVSTAQRLDRIAWAGTLISYTVERGWV